MAQETGDRANEDIESRDGFYVPGDEEAVAQFKRDIAGGKHWFVALLAAMNQWRSPQENWCGRDYCYLVGGEAFDWLLLAERLCETVDGAVPEDEKMSLLFQGRLPIEMETQELCRLMGETKYRAYLNYFYGIEVEEALAVAVEEEVRKERGLGGLNREASVAEEVFGRIYGATEHQLWQGFRREMGHSRSDGVTLSQLKEFTYWLFKYRLKRGPKARVASDTKKGLEFLQRLRQRTRRWDIEVCPLPSSRPPPSSS
ncbi:MAG: hypothetical protein HYU86_01630 [Chloroflexi bacterium]|nr:hypothetical protein [Chloroflexota bacterium]